jgi:hypothetical protein
MNTTVPRTRIAKGIVTSAVTVALLVAFLMIAGGDAAPTPAAAHPPPADGCSFVSDSGSYYNFHNACDSHDLCYVGHWRDKVGCDYKFLQDMRSYCYGTYQWWQWQRSACLARTVTYYTGVSTLGWACYWHWIPISNTCR